MFGSSFRNGINSLYNVWNYNPKTDQYRYVWGSNETARTNPRNPGDLRVPAETNHPGGIRYSSITVDKNDNIWVTSYKSGGELWMFNTTSMMFVRMQGLDQDTFKPSIGANPGQPGEDVWPGYSEAACLVTDSNNDIWLLSGYNSYGVHSSVWHFNTTSLLWTFITGSITEQKVNYNATYFGGVWNPGCFIDENDRVWLYSGWGNTANGYEDYGSIWTFDTRVKREWEPEFGPDTVGAYPVSVSADYHPDNHPGSGEGMLFVDRMDGTAMMVATAGYTDDGNWGPLNQVWLYNKTLKQWKLVHGDTHTVDADITTSFVNYRQTGSNYTGVTFPARTNGINFNGDMYIVGGGPGTNKADPNYNSIWLIPNDQCASASANKCSANAQCIEEMFGYSCVCNEGFTGDGFTCNAIPVAPVAAPVASAPVAATPKAKTSSASVVGPAVALMALALAF